jgi:hypothetical protein
MTTRGSTARAWAAGGVVFAAAMLIMVGIWQILVGIAAIAEDEFFVVAPNYTYEIDTTAWGWIHLILGVILVLTGFFLFTGSNLARVVGIAAATISAIANFFFLPYYPLWALAIIAVDVFIIWALASTWSRRPDSLMDSELADYRNRERDLDRDRDRTTTPPRTTNARPAGSQTTTPTPPTTPTRPSS